MAISLTHGLQDSGERVTFDTGAQKEPVQVDKGRYDLIPPEPLHRLAVVYARGAEKYDANNWRKGVPLSRLVDSAFRHLNQWRNGMRDEDHLAQCSWQIFALMYTTAAIERGELPKELNDIAS